MLGHARTLRCIGVEQLIVPLASSREPSSFAAHSMPFDSTPRSSAGRSLAAGQLRSDARERRS